MTFGSFRMDTRQKLTVREILSEVSTVRPEPFGSELKAEFLMAEGGRRWLAITRAQRFFMVRVCNNRVYIVSESSPPQPISELHFPGTFQHTGMGS